jgi:hypothetical protein
LASATGNLEEATITISKALLAEIPKDKRVAIDTSVENEYTDYVFGHLEEELLNARFRVLDRRTLDRVRAEQTLQYGGEVDKLDMVELAKIAGANIIISVTVRGTGNLKTLMLRAIDTQTGDVIASKSATF